MGDSVTRAELAEALGHVYDLERLMTRTVYGSATPREVYAAGVHLRQAAGDKTPV